MNYMRIFLIVGFCFLGIPNNIDAQKIVLTEVNDQTKREAIRLAYELAENAKLLPQDIFEKLNAASVAGPNFSDEQLEKLLKSVLGLMVPNSTKNQELRSEIAQVHGLLVKKLQSHRVTGLSFAIDPNAAFFIDNQDPEFTVTYKDARGNLKTRRYLASINSFGWKVEFAVVFNFIYFTNTAFNFYDSEKVIELGTGFEAAVSFLGLSYIPFKNIPGGMFIVQGKLGYCGLSGVDGLAVSVITGGTLTPLP